MSSVSRGIPPGFQAVLAAWGIRVVVPILWYSEGTGIQNQFSSHKRCLGVLQRDVRHVHPGTRHGV